MARPDAIQQGIASRQDKSSTPVGSAVFVGLRLLDPFLQYGLLAWGWGDVLIKGVGGTPLPLEGSPVALGLPYWRLTLFCMSVAGAAKTIYYLLHVSEAAMPLRAALFVGFFKAFSTTINTLVFCITATSAAKAYASSSPPQTLLSVPPALLTSIAVFVLGMSVEVYAELQRKWFKADPYNKGKPYTGGLFSVARHINYGGYSVWKTGMGIASAGWIWGALTLASLIGEFRRRVIPGIDQYCQERVSMHHTLLE
jgi:protein-S-isoprenylcysteine O-methyltransferase Ste14